MGAWLSLFMLLGVGVLILLRGEGDTLAGFDIRDIVMAAAGIAMILFIGSSLRGSYRGRVLSALRDVAVWCALLVMLVAGYSYRDELMSVVHRVTGELSPPGSVTRADTVTEGERAVRIRRRPDGHFIARTEVNGLALPMLVDTGASTVVLKPADAERLGIDVDRLAFRARTDRQRHHLCRLRPHQVARRRPDRLH